MQLYFSPLACSMATRITFYEAGIDAVYHHVDHATRRAPDGTDVRSLHPLGYVPVLVTDDGVVLTENAAILQYVGDGTPLVPARDRARLQQWLSFIGTELHKGVFVTLLDRTSPDGAKRYALANAESRLAALSRHLEGRDHLLDAFTVADAYLFTVLNWCQAVPVHLARWPVLSAYMARVRERDAVLRAVKLETELFVRERGQTATPPSTKVVIDRFNDVFQRHDPAALDTLVDDACVIENTDGARHEGKAACVAAWRGIATDPANAFELEDVAVEDDRATIRWRLRGGVRGVNLMRVRGGRIVEALGYVKR